MDLDGVVYRGNEPIPGSAEFIAWLQKTNQPFLFLTNHSSRTLDDYAAKLARMGMVVRGEQFITSATVTAQFLRRERRGKMVFLIGEEGMAEAFKAAEIKTTSQNPDLVVVGFDRMFDYSLLNNACRYIFRGAEFIGTNADNTYPLEDGPAPECGPLLAAIENATGRKPLLMGKPEQYMYEEALQRLGVDRSAAVMVGDRLDTDIAGAKRAGIRSILVLSGATTQEEAKESKLKADVVVADLAACRSQL